MVHRLVRIRGWAVAMALVGGMVGVPMVGGLFAAAPVVAQMVDERKAEGDRLFEQGNKLLEQNQNEGAIASLQKALAIYRELKARQQEGQTLKSIGNAYTNLKDYPKVIEYQQQALDIAREIKDPDLESRALNNLGNAYRDSGDAIKGIEYLQQSLAISERSQNHQMELMAINQAEQILNLAKRYQNKCFINLALVQLGDIYRLQGNPVKAIHYYQQALTNERQRKNPGTESLQLQTVGLHLGSLASAYAAQGNFLKAIEYHRQSLEIAQASLDRRIKASELTNFGYTLLLTNNFLESEKYLRAGLKELETVRSELNDSGSDQLSDAYKVSFFDTYTVGYELLQQTLIAQGKSEAALEVAEQSRARAFVELLAKHMSRGNQSSVITMESVVPSSTLQQIKQIAQSQQATLVIYSLTYDPKHPAFFGSRVPKAVRNLPEKFYIWVAKPTGEVFFKLVNRDPQLLALGDLVFNTREAIGARSRCGGVCPEPDRIAIAQQRHTQSQNLQQLHKLLIEPIADLLPKAPTDRVIFIPQGELFLVPFPALQDNTGKALIDQHTILTAPSIQVLDLTRQQRDRQKAQPTTRTALVVGNPTMPKVRTEAGGDLEQLSNLAGAEQEAQDIAKLFNTTAILGANAKKSAIVPQLSSARIIHLATHGLLDDFRGLGVPGAIALGPDGTGQSNDGLLTADEILDLKLNAELVVLSACDTGRGRITGDGVIGLSRSLITAGVPSIIVSLWKVPDASTAFLMTEFYKNLQQTPDKAQALRKAMLTTKQKYPDPLDWAAFTLIGEAE